MRETGGGESGRRRVVEREGEREREREGGGGERERGRGSAKETPLWSSSWRFNVSVLLLSTRLNDASYAFTHGYTAVFYGHYTGII